MNNGVSSGLIKHFEQADKYMLFLIYGLTFASFCLAPLYGTWLQAVFVGLGTSIAMSFIYHLQRGTVLSRISFAMAFMVLTALHINQGQGLIELHFGVFVLLAILLYYRDPLPIIVAAGTIAVHHIAFFWLQQSSSTIWVLSDISLGWPIIFLHAFYVIVETSILVFLARQLLLQHNEGEEVLEVITGIIASDNQIDLTVRPRNTNSSMTKGLNKLLETLDSSISQLREVSHYVLNTTHEVTSQTSSLVTALEDQNLKTQEIVDAVLEMGRAIDYVDINSQKAASMAHEANINTEEGNLACQKILANVNQLSDNMKEATKSVESLADRSLSIGTVLDVIRGIAEQTNLLALNAAIEAARAGEQGRGFAVVADEVRTLASRTQQSTEEIQNMIESLQDGSKTASESMQSSYQYVQECLEQSLTTTEKLAIVKGSVSHINDMNDTIASATSEQSAATQGIKDNAQKIKDISRATSTEIHKTSVNCDGINTRMNQLVELTKVFNVTSVNRA